MRGAVRDKFLVEPYLVLSKAVDSVCEIINFLAEPHIHCADLGIQPSFYTINLRFQSGFYSINLYVYGINLCVQQTETVFYGFQNIPNGRLFFLHDRVLN